MNPLIVRNKNAILELLQGNAAFEKISLVTGLKQDELTQKIVALAASRKIPVESMALEKMARRRGGDSREVIVAYLLPPEEWNISDLIDDLYKKKKNPFFLLLNRVEFENNIGIIARTAYAAGVNGLIYQGDQDRFINAETLHYSVGSIIRIPLIRCNIFEAIKELKKNGIPTLSLEMDGTSIYQEKLTGPVAFILGAEAKGVSPEISQKCDRKISLPMKNGIDSLNVGISAAIVMYEKIRQEGVL